jgi:hypothetical protein
VNRAWDLGPGVTVWAASGSPVAHAMDEVFAELAAPAARAGTGHALTTTDGGRGAHRLALDGVPLSTVADDALAPALEGALVGWAVRSRRDAVAFHAACVSWHGRAVLLVGAKGSGKSTLAGHLATAGSGDYHGDEITFVRFSDGSIEPFAKAATIKTGSFACFGPRPTWMDPVRGPVRYIAPAPRPAPAGPVRPVAIVLPRYRADHAGATAEPVPAEIAALELVSQTFGGLDRDPRTLERVVALASLPVVELTYSQLPDAAAAVAALAGAA